MVKSRISRQSIAEWCYMFKNGRTHVNNAYCEGIPSNSANAEIFARVNESILANICVTTEEIANRLDISLGSVHKIIAKHFEFHKVRTYPTAVTQQWLFKGISSQKT
ncbi:hypothetical protein AVEN_6971-1 [Araneus ventricosus]|uniref:Mos1 transposase HTH domain-containing protein n=1 Tax=Araneus ventricosus TaxID=182803 RepID=A0A4Y2TA10_ARAVE|nr:hypothetical protein AVEN_259200-1 [Araneus ventricosus]GBN96810.1 hypothetical protein AVEN_6971-1 [Araneus ventricosus]